MKDCGNTQCQTCTGTQSRGVRIARDRLRVNPMVHGCIEAAGIIQATALGNKIRNYKRKFRSAW